MAQQLITYLHRLQSFLKKYIVESNIFRAEVSIPILQHQLKHLNKFRQI